MLWLITALVLAAFVLRVVDLQRRPLHFDEGINVTMGHRTPAEVLALSQQTFDNDPPGHRLILGLWMRLAGPSPLSIRIFSVFFSLLAVALTYRLCRQMHLGFWPALAAAGFVAALPYSVDYAQQAKGYAMGLGMSMVSWWMWTRLPAGRDVPNPVRRLGAVPRNRGAVLITYAISTALALATHYYTLFLLPMQWLWLLGTRITRSNLTKLVRDPAERRMVLQALVAQLVACVPIGVWLALMAASLQVSTARSSTKMQRSLALSLLARILGEVSASQFAPAVLATIGFLVLAAALLVGALILWRSESRLRQAFWFGAASIVPLLAAMAMQLRVTFFFPRFLLYALPNLSLLIVGTLLPLRISLQSRFTQSAQRRTFTPASDVAQALDSSPDARRGYRLMLVLTRMPVIALTGVLVIGLAYFYTAPIYSADDYRPILTQVAPLIKPGDSALGTYIWMEGFFTSYAPATAGNLRWYIDSYSPDTINALMQPIANSSARIWSVNFARNPDAPTTLSVLWLKNHAALAGRFTWGSTSVLLFDLRPSTSVITEAQRSTVFEDEIRLNYAVTTQPARLGDSIVTSLKWTALHKVTDNPTIFLHLMSPAGHLIAQNDGDAVNGQAPAFTWAVGQPVLDRRAVLITSPLPPGDYTVVAGMYHRQDGTRLLTTSGKDGETVGVLHVTCSTTCP